MEFHWAMKVNYGEAKYILHCKKTVLKMIRLNFTWVSCWHAIVFYEFEQKQKTLKTGNNSKAKSLCQTNILIVPLSVILYSVVVRSTVIWLRYSNANMQINEFSNMSLWMRCSWAPIHFYLFEKPEVNGGFCRCLAHFQPLCAREYD